MLRIANGARLVAAAAAKQASPEASVVAHRATKHGTDLASMARAGINQVVMNRLADIDPDKGENNFDAPSMGDNPYESQLANLKPATAASASSSGPVKDGNAAKINGSSYKATSPTSNGSRKVQSKPVAPPKPDYSSLLIHSRKAKSKKAESNVATDVPKPDNSIEEKKSKDSVEAVIQSQVAEQVEQKKEEAKSDTPQFMDAMASENRINVNPSDRNVPIPDSDQSRRLKEGRAIPSSRAGRAMGFASLGAQLVWGTASESISRFIGGGGEGAGSAVASEANANNLAATLCRMRGAALKLGQMLSIQDESLLPPALTIALQQVRQGADAMPNYQLIEQLESQLGKDWRNKFESFDELPFAAASIGQVHRATIREDDGTIRDVVVKVQYPGVARSIDSDLRNLTMLVKLTGMAPKGLFIENVIKVCRDELKVECNYINEMANQKKFRELVQSDPFLSKEKVYVPEVVENLTTGQIITSEYAPGGTIDKAASLDAEERNRIGRVILYLTTKELFDWRLMQTDPNWGNFLYEPSSGQITLIDFGATRTYSKEFVDGYLRIVWASSNRDSDTLMAQSRRMGFLTGEEKELLMEAHKQSGFTVGEPFWSDEPFDFRGSNLSTRMSAHTQVFLKHRLTPPPQEVYTLHRKLAGAYMLCIKLGSIIPCRDILEQTVSEHHFDDGMDNPIQNPNAAVA